jgi:hypothetical protein
VLEENAKKNVAKTFSLKLKQAVRIYVTTINVCVENRLPYFVKFSVYIKPELASEALTTSSWFGRFQQ